MTKRLRDFTQEELTGICLKHVCEDCPLHTEEELDWWWGEDGEEYGIYCLRIAIEDKVFVEGYDDEYLNMEIEVKENED